MKYPRVFVLASAVTLAGSAGAQTIQGLSQELETDQANLPGLNKTMADTANANASLNKEYKLYVDDQKRKREWVQRASAEQLNKVKAPIERRIKIVTEDYNSHCAEKRVGKLRRPQYDNCVRWKARAQRQIDGLKRQWANYAKEWNNKNIKPINEAFAKQKARMTQIEAQMKANFKRYTDAQDAFIATTKRINQILASLKHMCDPRTPSSTDTPFTKNERMKWCSNIDFDGVSRKLPPMYHYQGTGGATAN